MGVRWLIVPLVMLCTASTAQIPQVPQGRFDRLIFGIEWSPGTGCRLPDASFERSMGGAPAVMSAYDRWKACVESQAANDARYAVQVVRDGREKALTEGAEEMGRNLERGF